MRINVNPELAAQVQPLLNFFITQANAKFQNRVISIFKLGSLGEHGDFSLCSDVDVALMLDEVKDSDYDGIQQLNNEIKATDFSYADRLSIFWSSYDTNTFDKGIGRFPPLDRLDFRHGILLAGIDRRNELPRPTHADIVLASTKFISSFMLVGEKADELTAYPENIAKKGARYFTKFILFPVRLIFTLDKPGVIGSNLDAVEHFNQTWSELIPEVKDLVNIAYKVRALQPNQVVDIDVAILKKSLIPLYRYCINRYRDAMVALGNFELAKQLALEKEKLMLVER